MKILLINQVFYPDETAVSQLLTDLAEELVKSGHTVEVLAGCNDYEHPKKHYPAHEIYKNIIITRILSTSFNKRHLSGRIINMLVFNAKLFGKLAFINKKQYQCLLCSTVPPMIATIAAFAAKLKNIPFVYWIMDLQPDEAIAAGILKKGFVTSIVQWMGGLSLASASLIIVLDRFMQRRLVERNVPEARMFVALPWAVNPQDTVPSQTDNPFRKEHAFKDRFIIMYSGNHSICHPLDTILDACIALRNDKQYLFVFIGNGVRTKDVSDYKQRHRLDNILQLPHQPRASLHYSLTAADLHIIVMGAPFVGIVHPCKIYSIMALGLPFVAIGPEDSHLSDIVREAHCGYSIRHGNVDKFVASIQELSKQPENQKKADSDNMRMYSRSHFLRSAVSPGIIRRIGQVI
jgi:glycosyltransferase involved in cell wall biosynthesis